MASRMATTALGDGPNALSLAPSRNRIGFPVLRSMASGATNGTEAGSSATSRVTANPRLLPIELSRWAPIPFRGSGGKRALLSHMHSHQLDVRADNSDTAHRVPFVVWS